MWQRLEADVGQMSEYLQAQLRDCHDFQHTLEPIYRYVTTQHARSRLYCLIVCVDMTSTLD
jgi:hypothetical protein